MATNRPGLLFEANFNSGTDVATMGFKYSGNRDVTMTTIGGQRAAKIFLDHYNSDYSYRTEIQPNKLPSTHFDSGMFAKVGREYWYGMRVFLDEGWRQVDKADSVLMQFHSQPDAGEAWRNPPVALQVVNKNGAQHFNLIVRSDASAITTGSGESRYDSSRQYDLGKIDGDIGKWTDLVWNVKWNYDGTGFLRLYKDGQVIADLKGANCFNDATGPYLKMGLYKYEWQSSTDTGPNSRTVYLDDFRVGGADAGYATVAPGDGSDAGYVPAPEPVLQPAPAPDTAAIYGTSGDDVLKGTAKSEIIDGRTGFDLVDLSGASSSAAVDLAAGKADLGNGHVDTLVAIEGAIGSAYGDRLVGNAGANKLRGLAGDDSIRGGAGADTLAGGDGNDTVTGDDGSDVLFGGAGNDVLTGGAGDDWIKTGAGADRIVVSAPGHGTDRVTDFTASADRIDLTALDASLRAAHGSALAADWLRFVADGGATRVVVDVDGAGSAAAQTILVLDGTAPSALKLGANVVGVTMPAAPAPAPTPTVNIVTTQGTDGDDRLTGTSRSETIHGHAGNDTLDLRGYDRGFRVDLQYGTANDGAGNADTVWSVENAIGTNTGDTLLGTGYANKLRGLSGNDVIDGRSGDDTLAGGDGADRIDGGSGDDVIYGGRGADTLTGGYGADVFVKEALGEGADRILDFKWNDRIDLVGVARSVKSVYGYDLTPEYLRFVQSGSDALIRVDVDAGGWRPSETLFVIDDWQVSDLKVGENVLIHPYHDMVG